MYFGKIHGFRDRFDVVDRSWCLAIPLDSIPSFVIHKFGKPTLILDIFIHVSLIRVRREIIVYAKANQTLISKGS